MRILVDADACPRTVKELLFKSSERLKLEMIMVANKRIWKPDSEFIKLVVVEDGPDVADDHIVEIMEKGDLVISADIPLADRVIKKGAIVLDPKGNLLTDDNIGDKLATRNLMEDLRSSGMETGGPGSYTPKDKQEFARQLDKYLNRSCK